MKKIYTLAFLFSLGSLCGQKVDILGDAMITGKVEVMDTIIFSDGSQLASACLQILSDLDADTKIEVEQIMDEDKIRFMANGIEIMVLDENNLTIVHNGNSLFIGTNAGKNDDGNNYNLLVGHSAGSGITSGVATADLTMTIYSNDHNSIIVYNTLETLSSSGSSPGVKSFTKSITQTIDNNQYSYWIDVFNNGSIGGFINLSSVVIGYKN